MKIPTDGCPRRQIFIFFLPPPLISKILINGLALSELNDLVLRKGFPGTHAHQPTTETDLESVN